MHEVKRIFVVGPAFTAEPEQFQREVFVNLQHVIGLLMEGGIDHLCGNFTVGNLLQSFQYQCFELFDIFGSATLNTDIKNQFVGMGEIPAGVGVGTQL